MGFRLTKDQIKDMKKPLTEKEKKEIELFFKQDKDELTVEEMKKRKYVF